MNTAELQYGWLRYQADCHRILKDVPCTESLMAHLWWFQSLAGPVPSVTWTIISQRAHPDRLAVRKTTWDQYQDVMRFDSRFPLEQVKTQIDQARGIETKPAIKSEERMVAPHHFRGMFDQVRMIAIPIGLPNPTTFGLDGYTCGFSNGDSFNNAQVEWWGEGPEEWRPFVQWWEQLQDRVDSVFESGGEI